MTIKRKIGLSNLLMLIVPVLLIIVASIGVLAAFIGVQQGAFRQLSSPESALFAKGSISSFAEHYNKKASFQRDRSLNMLKLTLGMAGFRFSFAIDGQPMYSSLTDEDKLAVTGSIPSYGNYSDKSLLMVGDKVILVRQLFEVDGKTAVITAVNSARAQTGGEITEQAEMFITYYILVVVILAVSVIALTNGVLTARLAKSLLTPLTRLSVGAKQIQQGNLYFEMSYDKNDEFLQVFHDFDDMRIRLRDTVENRLRDDESQRAFIAGISHDLRTPLTTIRGYAEGLRDGVASTAEKQRKYLDVICRKSSEMERMVERLFLLSKLETGRMPLNTVKTPLCEWFSEYVQSTRDEWREKGVELSVTLPSREVCVSLDSEQMHWIMSNLLENSAKYKSGDCANVRITLSLPQAQDIACVTVSDDGPGIAGDEISHVFEMFYRADRARTRPETGSGLGLAIVKRIVQAHGGTIEAFNQNGLTIRILLSLWSGEEKRHGEKK